jgi:hypothetical protein
MRRLVAAIWLVAALSAYGSDLTRQADLDCVANVVPAGRANFFYQLDRSVYQAAADALAADLPTLTDAEFYDRLAALIVFITSMSGVPWRTSARDAGIFSPLLSTINRRFRLAECGTSSVDGQQVSAAPAGSRELPSIR